MHMSFEFEQENFQGNQFTNTSSSGSVMVDFLIKQGIVKDATSANIALGLVAFVGILLSIYFFIFGFNLPQPTPQQAPTPASLPGQELEL
jgi:hypothetical protein